MTFPIHTADTAPAHSRHLLQLLETQKGQVPNVAGVMATAPATLEAFVALEALLGKTSLTPAERDIVFITVSRENDSPYCLKNFSARAAQDGISADDISVLKHGSALSDRKLEALRQYTLGIIENRGRPPDARIEEFISVGYTPATALEIVLAIAFNTLTNYTARLAHPPMDGAAVPTGARQPELRV
jgi:alkylhydroperoxidase family enzyme